MRNLYVVLIAVGTLGAGVALGELLARRQLSPYLSLAHDMYASSFNDYVDIQHFKGTAEDYEAALTDHLSELEASAKWPIYPSPTRFDSLRL